MWVKPTVSRPLSLCKNSSEWGNMLLKFLYLPLKRKKKCNNNKFSMVDLGVMPNWAIVTKLVMDTYDIMFWSWSWMKEDHNLENHCLWHKIPLEILSVFGANLWKIEDSGLHHNHIFMCRPTKSEIYFFKFSKVRSISFNYTSNQIWALVATVAMHQVQLQGAQTSQIYTHNGFSDYTYWCQTTHILQTPK